jgi:hypothetical protein
MAIATPKSGDIVSFQLVQNGLLGDERVQVRVSAADVDYQTAKLIDPQLNVKHTTLFPYFKDAVGGIDNPSAYKYVTFQLANGAIEVIGVPWIKEATYRIVDGRIETIQITNFREEFRGPLLTFLKNLGASYTITGTET